MTTEARPWSPVEPCDEGQHDAHEAHMAENGECPWCGASSLGELLKFQQWLTNGGKP